MYHVILRVPSVLRAAQYLCHKAIINPVKHDISKERKWTLREEKIEKKKKNRTEKKKEREKRKKKRKKRRKKKKRKKKI